MTVLASPTRLDEEAEAFDSQIDQRIAHGHIPDLRRVTDCDWFENNPWRRPAYVALDFGEQFALIRDTINELVGTDRSINTNATGNGSNGSNGSNGGNGGNATGNTGNVTASADKTISTHGTRSTRRVRVLEVGCGPGYLSLELARAGFDVTGLDLSPRSIAVATRFAAVQPWLGEPGELQYIAGDLLSDERLGSGSFDAIVFLGALHHFPDQDAVMQRVHELLRPGGSILVHEPVRDCVSRRTATVSYLIRTLLGASGTFHKQAAVPQTAESLALDIDALHATLRYEDASGHKLQSVNDNEAGYAEMYPRLKAQFTEQRFAWRYGLFHELIGGLRFPSESQNASMAWLLRELDRSLVDCGAIDATEFFFAGTRA